MPPFVERQKTPYAERKKKFIDKLKKDGTFDQYKKKRAELEKQRRNRIKQAMEKMTDAKRNQLIVENRIKNRKGVQKFRQRQKELKSFQNIADIGQQQPLQETLTQPIDNQPTNFNQSLLTRTKQISASINFPHSYKTKSALNKAAAKTTKTLPSSPSKRKAVVAKMFRALDAKDQEDIYINGKSEKKKIRNGKELSPALIKDIQLFYERDEVSRISPNVKDARKFVNDITGQKEVKQIRHLMYKLSEVYNMFVDEHKANNEANIPPVKLSKFCDLRPKHVFVMSETPRNVCFCIYHSNFIQCTTVIHKYVPEIPKYGPELTELLVCENASRNCYFKTCVECASDKIDEKIKRIANGSANKTETVQWLQLIKEENVNRVQNKLQVGTRQKLIDYFLSIYPQFLKHSYIKRERKRVSSDEHLYEALLQIDFAENFKCECQDEAQTAHYNQRQVSLFTTALHHGKQIYPKVITSDNLHHTKETIAAYLHTIFKELPSTIKTVKVWSDGPSSQFKNKFIAAIIPRFEKEFEVKIIWNYFATAHGKSCIDGIGASVKFKVKNLILSREVIVNDTKDFASAFNSKKSSVDLIELTHTDIDKINSSLNLDNLILTAPAVRNISSFHQLKLINNRIIGFVTSADGYNG